MLDEKMPSSILVIDDEEDIRHLIAEIFRDEGYLCEEAQNSEFVIKYLANNVPELIVLDIWLQGSEFDGIELLKFLKNDYPTIPVIMISGHADIETAVNTIKLGAYDFIEKPFEADRLIIMAERAMDSARLRRENEDLRRKVDGVVPLVGVSSSITQIQNIIERVAPTDSRVLITGEAGVGKEVIARLIHSTSNRKDSPLIVLNCATMIPERMELELFGSEGGVDQKLITGIFEKANGGTLFLDEVADMPLETQGKIVRVLQEQRFQRVGGIDPIEVNIRVIASSNRDLKKEITSGKFREDLYYRLCVVPLPVPALRTRPEDIPVLFEHFMDIASRSNGIAKKKISKEALVCLQSYDWPGNVRQLRNIVDWILIMANETTEKMISTESLPPEIGSETPVSIRWDEGGEVMGLSIREAREVFERQYLKAQVSRFGGNVSKTAEFIGMERSALHRKLKSLGIFEKENPTNKTL